MKLIIIPITCLYFNSAYAMMSHNPVKAPSEINIPIIGIDCDYDPDTGNLFNCKGVSTDE